MALRFLLCDDHALFREGLAVLLERREGWRVVGQAADGEEAVRLAAELRPDLILLDVAMPGMSGIEAASALRAVSPHSAILALSMYGDAHYRRACSPPARSVICSRTRPVPSWRKPLPQYSAATFQSRAARRSGVSRAPNWS